MIKYAKEFITKLEQWIHAEEVELSKKEHEIRAEALDMNEKLECVVAKKKTSHTNLLSFLNDMNDILR